jgi:hypothetical protein
LRSIVSRQIAPVVVHLASIAHVQQLQSPLFNVNPMMELLAATAVADQDISIIKQLASMKQFCNWLEAQPVTVYSNLVSAAVQDGS